MTTPEDVFVGPAVEVSAPPLSSTATLTYRALADGETDPGADAKSDPDAAPPTPWGPGGARHAAGYGAFADYVLAQGDDPRAIARSGSAFVLLGYLRQHAAAVFSDPELLRAAGIFLGNCIASLRADAVWQGNENGPHMVGAGRRGFVPAGILVRLVDPAVTSSTDFDTGLGSLVKSLSTWTWEAADDALPPPPLPTPRPAASGTPRYVRPPLPAAVFFDDAGQPIDYGNRWGTDSPPEDSYSVTRNTERYAGLHTVAHALIAYLERVYDVAVIHEGVADAAATLLHPRDDVVELVRLQPRDPQAAPLRFVLSGYPGVIVEAGVLHDFAYPRCGCEACDEGIDYAATEIEDVALAVAAGGYAEQYPVGLRRDLRYGLVSIDAAGERTGSQSGGGETTGISAERLAHGEAVLAALPHGWQPWPLRD